MYLMKNIQVVSSKQGRSKNIWEVEGVHFPKFSVFVLAKVSIEKQSEFRTKSYEMAALLIILAANEWADLFAPYS